ncbi:DNA-binding protein RFX5 [Osmerus eperlanus]|uniref:DNA-binding protein RFX5 n=1 Tax=Osmerus eperlanus TaxID=29151 RepID=UPI002E1551C3
MTEERLKADPSRREGLEAVEGDTEPSRMVQKLGSNVSKSVQGKVESILKEVQHFSDSDKLYLYLQLPSGPSAGEKSSSSGGGGGPGGDSSSFNTADQLHTCNWIRSHLEEHADTCLPKQDVYETYKRYCDNLQHRPLSAANFGKIIRDIFPNIKARRLGGRGQSKYCYSGIRRKTVLNMPLLPSMDLKNDPSELTELVQTYKQEVTEAACELICDWAQKILKRSFDTVVEIARFLVQEHIVNPRCSQAELVTSAALAGGPAKPAKVVKKNSSQSKGGGADLEGSASELKREKEGGEQSSPGKPPPSDKPAYKGQELVRPGGRDLQVEALMKSYPKLLPRSSVPDKTQLSVRSSPPSLAPKDSGVKVIAMATLPQQQGGALPLMILPQSLSLSYDRESAKAPPPPVTVAPAAVTSVVQRARAAPKRAAETPAAACGTSGPGGAPAPPKRKRGRPRKTRPEDALPPPPPLPAVTQTSIITGGVIQKACSSSTSSCASSQLLEFVIQEQQGLVGEGAVQGPRGVVVQCQAGQEGAPRPVLLLQSPVGQAGWEVGGRTMVEVIQRNPRLQVLEDRSEMEITLTPVDPHSDLQLTGQAPGGAEEQSAQDSTPTGGP